MTPSMQAAIEETQRRRSIQEAYNREHGITPTTVQKNIQSGIKSAADARNKANRAVKARTDSERVTDLYLKSLEEEMLAAAENLEFERAAQLRDRIMLLKDHMGEEISSVEEPHSKAIGRRSGRKPPRPAKKR
jgi:excinuclease ABC subunit B